MQITTTIQQTKSIEIDIPCFYEYYHYSVRSAIGVLSKDDIISIYTSEIRTVVSTDVLSIVEKNVVEAVENWKPITEERFFEIHAEAMKKLSILPTLKKEEI